MGAAKAGRSKVARGLDIMSAVLRLATRGSELALVQTREVARRLREAHAGLEVAEVIICTTGDKDTEADLSHESVKAIPAFHSFGRAPKLDHVAIHKMIAVLQHGDVKGGLMPPESRTPHPRVACDGLLRRDDFARRPILGELEVELSKIMELARCGVADARIPQA